MFNTDGLISQNDREIENQLRFYHQLLTHCLLANEIFASNILATGESLQRLLDATRLRGKRLEARGFASDDPIFPLVTRDESEVLSKLAQLMQVRTLVRT